ncbi:MAG: hypothetical protein HXS48_21945 [Theionarchaea archaeon]|nr:hypothetical protein [Theionarchaea archaeon]
MSEEEVKRKDRRWRRAPKVVRITTPASFNSRNVNAGIFHSVFLPRRESTR